MKFFSLEKFVYTLDSTFVTSSTIFFGFNKKNPIRIGMTGLPAVVDGGRAWEETVPPYPPTEKPQIQPNTIVIYSFSCNTDFNPT